VANEPYRASPSVEPTVPAPTYFNLRVSPGAFGGHIAAGLEKAGAALSQTGDTWEEMRVDAAVNDSIKQAEAITEEYEKLPADQKVSREQEYRDRAAKVFDTAKGQFPGWYAQHFDNQVRPYQFRYINGKISTSAITAGKQITVQTNDATLGRAVDLGRKDPFNEDNVNSAMELGGGAESKNTEALYGRDPQMLDQAYRNGKAKVVEGAPKFQSFVEKYRVELGPKYPQFKARADALSDKLTGDIVANINNTADPVARKGLIDANRGVLGDKLADELEKQGSNATATPGASFTPSSPLEYARRRLLEMQPPQSTPAGSTGAIGPHSQNYTPASNAMVELIQNHAGTQLHLAQLPSDVIGQAREVALRRGPAGVAQFMADNGYPKSGAWCGEFAAAVLRSSGGTPPKNPEVASNWRTYGLPVSEPKEGFIAIRRGSLRGYPVGTGETGSHVTFVDSVDKENGTFVGVGGNQASNREKFRISDYDFRSQ
jgi:uncharacterized protein (TIGR02594 family)